MGPQAPKDPEKQRPFFYIMREKAIYGSKQEDGRGIQFLYQSDGRLESSANVVGLVEDKNILNMLSTVEGFKKLVHSVGVSMEFEDSCQEANFVFQMYGKEDLYGGGTNLSAVLKGDGSEKRIYLSEVQWREDDNVPGQIRVEMEEPDLSGSLTVRLYLNDGYEAPAQEEDMVVDFESEAYKSLVEDSLISLGNTKRIYDVITRAKAGKDVTIAFIGGSITQGAGATPINKECYAYKTYQRFKTLCGGGNNIHYIKAGVGGTPSELGMLRFDRDVLRDKKVTPDIVIVEFAVNDEGDETKGNCYESLVRKILKLPNQPGVILLFSVFADDYNLQERLLPVGQRYDLPMVSLKNALTPQFYDKSQRVLTKNQYFYDIYHPTNLGHTVMADCLQNLFAEIILKNTHGKADFEYVPDYSSKPAIGCSFDDVFLMDKQDTWEGVSIEQGGFVYTDSVLQSVEMDESLEVTPEFPYNWMYDGSKNNNRSFIMRITCKRLVLIFKDSGEVDAAKADVYVNGSFVRVADPYINRWLHCNPIIVIDNDAASEHLVEIRVQDADINKKFTILGFGIVS